MRQIILDTETTGIDPASGHRLIELGCLEIENRRQTGRNLHLYFNPERLIDIDAIKVHGITNERVAHEPLFGTKVDNVLEYLTGAELIIHNAAFDVGFLDAELTRTGRPERIAAICRVTDTLAMARKMFPGQKASLDALCKRFTIDNSGRVFHGALLDAQLLAEVYLQMTGGQSALGLGENAHGAGLERLAIDNPLMARLAGFAASPLPVPRASILAREAHFARRSYIMKKSGKTFVQALDWDDA